MKKGFYCVPLVMLVVFAACKDKSGEEQKEIPAIVTPAVTNTQNPAPASPAPVVIQPGPSTTINIPAPATTTAAATGLNPAHGQPGHRCEIPVGAPLSSAPSLKGANPVVTTTTAPAQQTVTIPTTPVKVAAGMNPAHGEPGHRCDIAVGAPLNSPPATAKPTGANTPISIAPEARKQ
ncbi:MAG TPA: hypothetical protein VGO58_04240 [Chitinophagaceae bacterium]|jgi:hypothetical protein|nr:hypothetical protein [Chitinophagaceae bacterium]